MSNREVIGFDEIRVGDLLSVSYQEGKASMYSYTRTIVSNVVVGALDKVWLNEGGHTIVHRNWNKLRIVRLDSESIGV